LANHLLFLPLINNSNQRTVQIPLYHFQLSIPSDWSLFEVNRRPEPHNPGDPQTGHDCAEYLMTSSNGKTLLYLKPTCGYFESVAETWPPDAVIAQEMGSDTWLIRYWDVRINATVYSQAGVALWPGSNGLQLTHLRQEPPVFAVQGPATLTLVQADVHCSGETPCSETFLLIVDGIIASITAF
jgi:hypothetical protein